uniref:Shavenoid isoform B-like N-terminal domain-containing protein n=1 Tax=Plectus sambesii TaxID=2011161 RepID=A0A914W3Q7_9BILA
MDGRFVCIWALLLGAWSVTTVVGGAISRRSAPTTPLIVRRGYHTPDLFTIDANNACAVNSDDCLKLFNATTFKSEKNATTVASCQCQCPTNRPVYLPSRRQCVASLDECRRPIPFEVGAEHQAERWAPTFFLPLQSNVFAVENRIKWTDGGVRVAANGSVNCSVDDVGLLTDTGWMSFADRHLFRLTEANGAAYLLVSKRRVRCALRRVRLTVGACVRACAPRLSLAD